jgi:nitroreductase
MSLQYPKKSTPANHEINELIKKRWSPVAFSPEPIETEIINSLFEAMRWAPSCFNEQPWRVIYATKDKPAEFERLSGLLNEGNYWAKEAYLLLVVCTMPNFVYNQKPNRYKEYDAGAGIENLFFASCFDGSSGARDGGI